MKTIAYVLISWGPWGALLIALLDSAGVPLPAVMDALVVATAASDPYRGWLTAALATIGSVAGNLFLYSIARKGGEAYLEKHSLSRRAQRFRRWFRHYGMLTVFISALLPIPLPMKIFVISAGALDIRQRTFLLTVLAARIPRYFGLAYLGMQVGTYSTVWIKHHWLELTAASVALFFALLLAVMIKDRMYRRAVARA